MVNEFRDKINRQRYYSERMIIMVTAKDETERRLLQKMDNMGFPWSVKTTVVLSLRHEPEQTPNMESLLDKGATAREMVKAVQPLINRYLEK